MGAGNDYLMSEVPALKLEVDPPFFKKSTPEMAGIFSQRRTDGFARLASTTLMEDTSALMEDGSAMMGGGLSPEGEQTLMMVVSDTPSLDNISDKPQGLK